jgi:hypothetical protein
VKSGFTTDNIIWPDIEEIHLGYQINQGEQERENPGREEQYLVTFVRKTDTYDIKPKTEAEFKKFPIGSKHKIKYSLVGGAEVWDGRN